MMLLLAEKDSVPSFDLGALFEHTSLRSAATKVMYVDLLCCHCAWTLVILTYCSHPSG